MSVWSDSIMQSFFYISEATKRKAIPTGVPPKGVPADFCDRNMD